jgi:prepilin-type N-terminal cleavage/methylation domain-containing protein
MQCVSTMLSKLVQFIMKNSGFTLLEMLIVIIILAIVGGIGSITIYNSFRSAVKARDIVDATWQPRIALERMSEDIGAIRSRLDLNASSPSQFTFTTIAGIPITYAQSGSYLMRTYDSVIKIMADGLTSLSFTYYDASYAVTNIASTVRCIQVTASINKNNTNTTLQTISCPRNLL